MTEKTQHMVVVDAVTWIESPGDVDTIRLVGNTETIVFKINEMRANRDKAVSFFIEYCCDDCRSAVEGDK